jgi:peptidoglycan/LPS O-acetylase OafA/YrhL
MKRIYELDSLRFVAILAVLGAHFRPPFNPRYWTLGLGWMGVDLFFAISGFLITTILLGLRGTPQPFRIFYARRSLRIFPPYYLVLTVLLVTAAILHNPVKISRALAAVTFMSSFNPPQFHAIYAHLVRHAPLTTIALPIDNHVFTSMADGLSIFWSLSVEEIFYLIWAPVVLLGSRRAIMTFAVLPLLFCPAVRLLAHSQSFGECFAFLPRFDSLMMGACIALVIFLGHQNQLSQKSIRILFLSGFAAMGSALLVMIYAYGGFRGIEVRSLLGFSIFGYTLVGISCSCLVGVCVSFSDHPFLAPLRLGPLLYVGGVSYMVYLIHIPVFIGICRIFRLFHRGPFLPGIGCALASSIVAVLIASLSWRYFESPILRFKDSRFKSPEIAQSRENQMVQLAN